MSTRNRPTSEPPGSALQRIRALSHLLDNALLIPGTTYRVGIDPILGLLPGAGDLVGTVLSAYIVLEAARFGLPRATLTRMVLNILIESVIGTFPVVGDLFDATWKANSRNLDLLEDHIKTPHTSRTADRRFLFLLAIVLALIVVGVTTFAILLINLLFRAIAG